MEDIRVISSNIDKSEDMFVTVEMLPYQIERGCIKKTNDQLDVAVEML